VLDKSTNSYNSKSLLNVTLIIIFFILSFKIFFLYDHYPTHDEILTIDRYLRFHTFLYKSSTNNHLLLSLYGTIINSVFGFNLVYLRFGSFLFLIFIFLIYRKIFSKNLFLLSILLLLITSSGIVFNHSYIFRGYYLSSFLFVLVFYFIMKYFFLKKKNKYIKLVFFFNFLLTIHSLYTLYLVVPIMLSIFIFLLQDNRYKFLFFNFIFYYLLPTFFLLSLSFVITGFALFTENLSVNSLILNFHLFPKYWLDGLQWSTCWQGFCNDDLHNTGGIFQTRLNAIFSFINIYKYDLILFLSLVATLLISFARFLFRKTNIFDFIILFFVLFYLFLNKDLTSSYLRVYVGFIFFFYFYLIFNIFKLLEIITTKVRYKLFYNYINNFSIIIITITLIFVKPEISIKNSNTETLEDIIKKISLLNGKCDLVNQNLNDYEKWVFLNYFPNSCYYFYDSYKKVNIFAEKKINEKYKKKEISFH
jgi:hypothetical protein